jgi:hypothetical protein
MLPVPRFVVVDARVWLVANHLTPSIVAARHRRTKAKQKRATQDCGAAIDAQGQMRMKL